MPIEIQRVLPGVMPPKNPALDSALATARDQAKNIRVYRAMGRIQTWQEIEARGLVPIPLSFKAEPCTFDNQDAFLTWWAAPATVQKRMDTATAANVVELEVVKHNVTVSGVVFKPQQHKAIDQLISLDEAKIPAALLTLETGAGKTFVAGGFIHYLLAAGRLEPDLLDIFPRVIYLTKKPVVLATADKLRESFGLRVSTIKRPDADAQVLVMHYQALSTGSLTQFFTEDFVELFSNKTKVFNWRASAPTLIICDECQLLKKTTSKMAKRVFGFLRGRNSEKTFWLFMSATPAVTLKDLWLFVLASRFQTSAGPVGLPNLSGYLAQIGEVRKIDKPNKDAMKRASTSFGPRLVAPPRDPRKYKAINRCEVIPFPNDRVKEIYLAAQADYIRAKEQAGELVGDLSMAQFQIFRATAELLKADLYADRVHAAVQAGKSGIVAVCYINTVNEVVARWAELGVKREDICVIIGGSEIITEDDIYPTQEWARMAQRSHLAEQAYMRENDGEVPKEKWYGLSRKEKTKMRKTQEYQVSRMRQGRTKAEQRARVAWLDEMMLGAQSDEARHAEIKAFLADKKRYCIYTFAAGGTGIDLDNQIVGGRPRAVFSTICYWAEEFVQALGRAYRINTQSDVEQTMLMWEDSIESSHVLKLLAPKIASINKLTGFDGDIEDALGKAIARKEIVAAGKTLEAVTDEIVDDETDDDGDDNDNE